MGVAAENVAFKYQITREMQDEYALLSYQRSWQAYQSGMYEEEIIPIKGIYQDEEFLRKRKMDKLVKRAIPLFDKEKGTVPQQIVVVYMMEHLLLSSWKKT